MPLISSGSWNICRRPEDDTFNFLIIERRRLVSGKSVSLALKMIENRLMSLKRFGVSLEDNVLASLDQYVIENGFSNRSQAIRFLIEKNVAEKKWQCNHIVAGTIILMYDQVKKEISSKVAILEQDYQDVILSSSQYYINKNFCLHIVTVMGAAHRLTELSDRLTTIKGIKHGKLVMSRAD